MNPITILTGPTAAGKSNLALELASKHIPSCEIISADSILVYKDIDIGSAKPSKDELSRIPHHLIDLVEPDQSFTVGDYLKAVSALLENSAMTNRHFLIVGGAPFYVRALLFGMWATAPSDPDLRASLENLSSEELFLELEAVDPSSASRNGRHDSYRLIRAVEVFRTSGKTPSQLQTRMPTEPDPRFRLMVVDRSDADLHARIDQRTALMLQRGLIDETKMLLEHYPESRILKSVGYEQTADFLAGRMPSGRKLSPGLEGLHAEICLATRQLVKHQRTWFRSLLKKVPNSKVFRLPEEHTRLLGEFS